MGCKASRGGMARQVALLRTHQMGPAKRRLLETLPEGFGNDIILCFDAQNSPPPHDFAKSAPLASDLMCDIGLTFPED